MTYSKLLGTCHSQYNLLCRTSADISIEKEMNNQTKADSLFGPAGRDVAICGHNSPSVTVRVSSVSLHTVTPIHARHTAFRAAHPTLVMHPARHCCFCWAGRRPCLQRPRVPGWDPDRVGMRGMQIRVRGGRECHKLNEEIEESGAWLAWPLARHGHSSIFRRAERLSAPSSSTPTAHVWTHQSRRPANSSTVVTSASAYSTDVDTWASWDTSLLYSKSVNIFSDPYTAVGSDSTAI